jgi:hypothetical protein
MPNLTVEQMDDLTTTTLRNLTTDEVSQMATTMQNTEVMKRWFKEKKIKKGGYGIEQRILNRFPGASRMITLEETDQPSIPRLMDKITVPWVHHETHYAWLIEEVLMNSGPSEIVDLLKNRRDAAMMETAEFMETQAWTLPSGSESPRLNAYGVPYWIVTDTGSSTGRQTTYLPSTDGTGSSSHSDIGGLVPSSTPGWTNWAAVYANFTASDFVNKIRRAMDNTNFQSPIGKEEFYGMKGNNWRLYCGEDSKLSIEDIATAQNESLGRDIAEMDGQTVIRGHALIRTVPLDSASLTPVYGLCHTNFNVAALRGAIFREEPQQKIPTNHRGRVVYTDTSFNFMCTNRRHNFVLHKAA